MAQNPLTPNTRMSFGSLEQIDMTQYLINTHHETFKLPNHRFPTSNAGIAKPIAQDVAQTSPNLNNLVSRAISRVGAVKVESSQAPRAP